jgi:beta-carotene hydroxylase
MKPRASVIPEAPAALASGLPHPPRHFMQASGFETAAYLAYGLVLAFVPGTAALAVHHAAWAWFAAAPVIAMLSVVAGYGFFLLAGTAHEGFHFTLHSRPQVSALLGIVFSAAVPGFIAIGFALSHWRHHRHTNSADDPDCEIFGRFRSLWSRLAFARLSANAAYRRNALRLLRSIGPDDEVDRNGLPAETLRTLARINLVWHLLAMACLVALGAWRPDVLVFVILLPLVATVLITGLNPYQEHVGTAREPVLLARTRSSPVLTLLMSGTNYHLEHHLYPRVPCWRLPALHRWLRETEWYRARRPVIEAGFWRSFSPQLIGPPAQYDAQPAAADTLPTSSPIAG